MEQIKSHMDEQRSSTQSESSQNAYDSLPQEMLDAIYKQLFTPQDVVLTRVVNWFHNAKDNMEHPVTTFTTDHTFKPPQGLDSNPDSRIVTLDNYTRILGHSIPDSWIYFNYELDTLSFYPCEYTQYGDKTSRSMLWGFHSMEWLKQLKEFLEQKDNNLAGVQSIALSEFSWPVSLEEDHVFYSEQEKKIARNRSSFKNLVHNGFQNLKVLKLVFSKDYDLRADDDRHRPFQAAEKEKIKEEIRGFFEEEKLSNPDCSVPEILLYDCFVEGVDGAPNCRKWIDEPEAKSALVFGIPEVFDD
ncbi:hypothetical protein GLAREA_03186 [Glarea lozoyensis ATCC 20868]|uniref:Uncharacterized protein n=1 Tax=Glarea lozoyensis (strain ATCC 20868 / MF5171) TaxID=1116229 RepID=S3D5D6_GLAL2|nr:uncharacterized protein GLAREA_03186 [Glarea lozoyensis ATCC 20868]EPE27271.1 hypothetical protein GLAREA_03186 [Glarea lozoyensis ATCC 20868]